MRYELLRVQSTLDTLYSPATRARTHALTVPAHLRAAGNPRPHRRCGEYPQGRHLPDQEAPRRPGLQRFPRRLLRSRCRRPRTPSIFWPLTHGSSSAGKTRRSPTPSAPRSSACNQSSRKSARWFSGSSHLRPNSIDAPTLAPHPHGRSGVIETGRPASIGAGMRASQPQIELPDQLVVV